MAQLQTLGHFLANYAHEHDGVLPAQLDDAVERSNDYSVVLSFVNPATGERSPWNFHAPKKKLGELDPREVIVSSPVFEDRGQKRRFQLTADGRTEIVKAP
jgi:hypothetical protein